MSTIESILSKINGFGAKIEPFLAKIPGLALLPDDKKLHFLAGMIIWGGLAAFGVTALVALLIVMMVAAAKEAYDYAHPDLHTADFWDWAATVLGALVALGVVMAVHAL